VKPILYMRLFLEFFTNTWSLEKIPQRSTGLLNRSPEGSSRRIFLQTFKSTGRR